MVDFNCKDRINFVKNLKNGDVVVLINDQETKMVLGEVININVSGRHLDKSKTKVGITIKTKYNNSKGSLLVLSSVNKNRFSMDEGVCHIGAEDWYIYMPEDALVEHAKRTKFIDNLVKMKLENFSSLPTDKLEGIHKLIYK